MARKEIGEGDIAPDFALPDKDGNIVKLSDLTGKSSKIVLYFYPRDNTPGCTKEACSFRDSMARLNAANAIVLGVSPDNIDSHKKFATKYNLTFPLLADVGLKAAKAFGVYRMKSLYGRNFLGIERSTFIINPDGRINKAFRKVRVDGHIEQILEATQQK